MNGQQKKGEKNKKEDNSIPFLSLLIHLLVILGVCAILWWGYTQIGAKLPEPLRIVLVIIIVIIAIYLLLWVTGFASMGSLR